jgi:subtilisin family serine protease
MAVLLMIAGLGGRAGAQEKITQWPEGAKIPERLEPIEVVEHELSSYIVTIAAGVSVSGWSEREQRTADRGPHSGLFVADRRGNVQFLSSAAVGAGSSSLGERRFIHRFPKPSGLAFVDPLLYIYDQETHRLLTLDVRAEGDRPRAPDFNYRFRQPTNLAVSPHGLIAMTDREGLFILQEGHEPVRYDRSPFPAPIGLAFSSWDTLQVLDKIRGSLVTIKFNRLKGGGIEFHSEAELELQEEAEWQAMTVFEGIVYLADESQVFAYITSDNLLIPVLLVHPEHHRISQIAVTHESLFTLDDDHLDRVPRPQPIDLALEGSVESSQKALLGFYSYLGDREMLPVRPLLARVDYEHLEDLLLEAGVLLAPSFDEPEKKIRVYYESQKQQVFRQEAFRPRIEPAPGSWEQLICWLNPDFCEGASAPVLQTRVEQGQELRVPDLQINRRLSRERILLEGEPLEWYLNRLVFAPEFRERSMRPEMIRQLNPGLEEVPEEEIFGISHGSVVVPVEKWAVTAAVPALEYADHGSPLWALVDEFEGASMYSRGGFVEQSARAMQPPDDPPDTDDGQDDDSDSNSDLPSTPGDDEPDPAALATARAAACDSLKQNRAEWLQKIKYPLGTDADDLMWPAIREVDVPVGVLEHASTVVKSHQIFCLDPDSPTWYTARNLMFSAQPDPATFETANQVVDDIDTFSAEAHHGTHVAALIAGRDGECWSGLVPSAKLVLIDLTDAAAVRRSIIDAIDVNTKVFNISQEFDGPQDDLHRTVKEFQRTLFVAAAGNSSKNLDAAAAVPAPARWGSAPNVVVVAASDWDGTILPQIDTGAGIRQGSNHGKKFVDLVAPGEGVFSASGQRKYGPATGTSQATPQVAAAAALLVGRWEVVVDGIEYKSPKLDPGDAKARLIATADWKPEYEGKVWGGRLNFGSAVMYPDRNHLRTTTGAQLGQFHTFTPGNDPNVAITNAPRYYERSGQGAIAPEKIPFRRILSLKRQPDGRYRMVLKEPRTDHLKILLDAVIEDDRTAVLNRPVRIECASFKVFNESTGLFEPDATGCANGLSVTQIQEYVQGEDYQIDWEEPL